MCPYVFSCKHNEEHAHAYFLKVSKEEREEETTNVLFSLEFFNLSLILPPKGHYYFQ